MTKLNKKEVTMYYSGEEIIEIAIRIEENGHIFYTTASEAINDNDTVKKLFGELAAKEISHIATFQNIAEHFEPENFEFSKDDAADYINHLADNHIFSRSNAGSEMAKKVHNSKEALDIAYKFEINSVNFYTELLEKTRSDSKKVIRQIIEEEKEHASELKEYM
ncbi:MAG: ferritin family protein [Lentimicrobiaceae bacterium]|nr:ferritin family protein [Lentimicrobiaceae bacterium]